MTDEFDSAQAEADYWLETARIEGSQAEDVYYIGPDDDGLDEGANDWYRHQGVRDDEDRVEEARFIW